MKNIPVITISRQYGSQGHEVGQKVAEKLSIPYFDKSLIALAAQQSGFSEAAFEYADEKAGSSLLYSMVTSGMGVAARIAGTNELPINDKLFLIQSDIIRDAANKGPCVIVGRCSNYILREYPNIFKVFIHAKKEDRVKHAIEVDGIDANKAADFVTKRDKQRANYYNFYSSLRWDDINAYNLTLDTSLFSVDEAADIIIKAIEAMQTKE
ncbi:MAG: cytidylate kinase-like family protein [Clostridia bacterium]|nr:cytidylate kinase-like family protein [Clostridia bacterium]